MKSLIEVKVKKNITHILYNKKYFKNEEEAIDKLIEYLKSYKEALN